MNRKSAVKPRELWMLGAMLFALSCLGWTAAHASDDECRYGCDDDPPGIDIDIDTDGGEGGDGYGGEGGEGGDADANSDASSEQNVTFEGNRSVGRGYVGGGSSTATDQKVRAISGGWLTGMAALRWDATDKELRTLRRADIFRERGMIASADKMECSTKVIYKAIGGDPDACYTELAGAHVVESDKRTRRDVEQDAMILALQAQLSELYEREIPETREQQQVVQMEVARVDQRVSDNNKVTAELEALAHEYRADRAAEQTRLESSKMAAQESLDTLNKAYPQQAVAPPPLPEDEPDDEF